MTLSKSSYIKTALRELRNRPEGMTFTEIMNCLADCEKRFRIVTNSKGNVDTTVYSHGTDGFMRMKRQFLEKTGRTYRLAYPFTLDQIDRLKVWSKNWKQVLEAN